MILLASTDRHIVQKQAQTQYVRPAWTQAQTQAPARADSVHAIYSSKMQCSALHIGQRMAEGVSASTGDTLQKQSG